MWKKRLSDEDAAALRAEMKAGLDAAKIHGIQFPMKILLSHVGLSQPFLYNILKGQANGTLPTSVKIRDGLRKMLAEAPGGDATTRAMAIQLAPATRPAALPPGRQRASPSAETVDRKRRNYEKLLAEQTPLRKRLVAYRMAASLSQRELAKQVGIGESSMSYFLTGKTLKTPAYRKALRFIDRHEPAAARMRVKEPAPSTAMVTHRPELNGHSHSGNVLAVAATMYPMHRARSAPPGSAQQIAKDFVDKLLGGKLALEAIEALIQIAKSSNDEGEHGQ